MPWNTIVWRDASSERGYFTSKRELGRNSYGWNSNCRATGFPTPSPPESSASGERNCDSLLDSIRSPRFIVYLSRFILLHRANVLTIPCESCRVHTVEHIRSSVYRIFGRRGWSYREEDSFFFFFFFWNFDKVLNYFRGWIDVSKKRIRNWNISNNCFFFKTRRQSLEWW